MGDRPSEPSRSVTEPSDLQPSDPEPPGTRQSGPQPLSDPDSRRVAESHDARDSPAESAKGVAREFVLLTLAALVIAIVIKSFFVQAFYIPSESMVPTLQIGDRILVNRLAYRVGDIEHGDIVVFSEPHPVAGQGRGLVGGFLHWLGQGIGVAHPDNPDFIKRVIGLPGDVVEVKSGAVYVNGRKLDEPYVNKSEPDTSSYGPVTVPDGMLFVMGDNRAHSLDSRFPPPTGLGFIPRDKVVGQAFVIIWPPSDAGWLH